MKKFVIALTMVTMFAGCLKPEFVDLEVEDYFKASVESFDVDTKTSMNVNKRIVWSKDDCLAIYRGSNRATKYAVSSNSIGQDNAEFVMVTTPGDNFYAGTEFPCNVAFYPYSDNLALAGKNLEEQGAYELTGIVLPQTQVYTKDSFADGLFLMAAVTESQEDRNLNFKNLLGAMKLQLKGTQVVKSIKVEGANGEQLAGAATVLLNADNLNPVIEMAPDAHTLVTLDCGEGVQLSETDITSFYIALPPVVFHDGFTVSVIDSDNECYTIATKLENQILRSSILVMPLRVLGGIDENIICNQYSDRACSQPDSNGAYVEYHSLIGPVEVYYEGFETPISKGRYGVVRLPVVQDKDVYTLVFRVFNEDGSVAESTKVFTCTPPAELTREQILLSGDYGQKVWMYVQDGTQFWGNAGHTGEGAAYDDFSTINGYWWGVSDTDGIQSQIGGPVLQASGDEDLSAYMVFDEDGLVQTFAPDGTLVRKGGYTLEGYDPERSNGWNLGTLKMSEAATLCPWAIDGSGTVTEFEVMHLTPQSMYLVYNNSGGGAGDWDEITYWRFVSGTPDMYTLEGKWTYGVELNKRYSFAYGNSPKPGEGFDYNVLTGELPGFTWGYAPDKLAEKSEIFAEKGQVFGDAAPGAYMEFKEDRVTSYSPEGDEVRTATWSIQMNDPTVNGRRGENGIELGVLTTTGPGLLFPWTYQEPGVPVTDYQIMYYDSNNIVLTKEGPRSWEFENMTMWVFSRVKED